MSEIKGHIMIRRNGKQIHVWAVQCPRNSDGKGANSYCMHPDWETCEDFVDAFTVVPNTTCLIMCRYCA